MEPLLFVLLALAALGYWIYQHRRKAARREALFALAHQRGLTYSRGDPAGYAGLPLRFLRQGDDRGVENVIDGWINGERVAVFDLWVMHESTDSDGHTHRSYKYFTCAYLPLPEAHFPRIALRPETLGSRLKDVVGFRDAQFESDDFNRRWDVRSDDRRFAYALVDARMMAWLLGVDGVEFELRGSHLLAASEQRSPTSFLVLHDIARGFRDRIPGVTLEWYPAPDGSTPNGAS